MALMDAANPAATGIMTLNGVPVCTTADLTNIQNILEGLIPMQVQELILNSGGGSSGGSAFNSNVSTNSAMAKVQTTQTFQALANGFSLNPALLPTFSGSVLATLGQLVSVSYGIDNQVIVLRGNPIQNAANWTLDEWTITLVLSSALAVTASFAFKRYIITQTSGLGSPVVGQPTMQMVDLAQYLAGAPVNSSSSTTSGPFTTWAGLIAHNEFEGPNSTASGPCTGPWANYPITIRAWAFAGF